MMNGLVIHVTLDDISEERLYCAASSRWLYEEWKARERGKERREENDGREALRNRPVQPLTSQCDHRSRR